MTQPVIIVGMHRSGTSLVGRLLSRAGLFSGVKQDSNNEATFFHSLNDRLLSQCGARWDEPDPVKNLWLKDDVLSCWERYVRDLMTSPRSIQYLGLRRYFKFGGISESLPVWGWKDPRNTYTLPFWLRIFPDAKVIYVERHGVDVAESLRVRAVRSFAASNGKYRRFRKFYWLRLKNGGFAESVRCLTLDGGFSLWRDYTNHAEVILAPLSRDKLLRIRYEDLLENPGQVIEKCGKFSDLIVSKSEINKLASDVNGFRAFSYRRSEKLVAFANTKIAELEARGYTSWEMG